MRLVGWTARTSTTSGISSSFGVVYGTQEDAVAQELAHVLASTFDLPAERAGLQERLFAVHTYFALLTKLIAAELEGFTNPGRIHAAHEYS